MKRILMAMVLTLSLTAQAQNTWEQHATQPVAQPDGQASAATAVDAKYLAGAVPVVDGKVVFSATLDAPGKTAQQVYDIIGLELSTMAREEGQYETSRIVLADTATHHIVADFQERLVFKNTALALDFTRMSYYLIARCSNGQATLSMTRISYLYEEERSPQTYLAEEWITDKYGLNRKGDKLARLSGKFRRKTIDRKDDIFNRIAEKLK